MGRRALQWGCHLYSVMRRLDSDLTELFCEGAERWGWGGVEVGPITASVTQRPDTA